MCDKPTTPNSSHEGLKTCKNAYELQNLGENGVQIAFECTGKLQDQNFMPKYVTVTSTNEQKVCPLFVSPPTTQLGTKHSGFRAAAVDELKKKLVTLFHQLIRGFPENLQETDKIGLRSRVLMPHHRRELLLAKMDLGGRLFGLDIIHMK